MELVERPAVILVFAIRLWNRYIYGNTACRTRLENLKLCVDGF